MPLDLSGVLAITALSWTIYQQYQINKICMSCPYFPANSGKEEKKNLKAI
jgi:hypothetical protein